MFKGTDKHPAGEFSKIIAANGGDENAFTAKITRPISRLWRLLSWL